MTDSSETPSSPYLLHDDLPADSGDPPHIDDLLPRGEGPRVLLNHGDVDSFGNAVSLGTALRSALDGPTHSFTALVGFLGGQYGDDDVPADDPTEILREELEEGLSGEDRQDGEEVGFRLAFGGVSSRVPEIALQAWYWICRWHHPELGNPEKASNWRGEILSRLEKDAPSDTPYYEHLLRPGVPPLWAKDAPPQVGFGEVSTTTEKEERSAWCEFVEDLEVASSDLLGASSRVLAYMLQQKADIRVQPHPRRLDPDDLEAFEVDDGFLHAKIYVVERGHRSADKATFVGSNNWTRAGIADVTGERPEEDILVRRNLQNIEAAVVHRSVCERESELASRVSRTADVIFDRLPVLGRWDGDEYTVLPADLAMVLCEAEGEEFTGETEPDLDPSRRLFILDSLSSLVDQLVTTGLKTGVAESYRNLFQNDVGQLIENSQVNRSELSAPDFIENEDVQKESPLFGGLSPAQYQMDGALRLMGMLSPTEGSRGNARGAFLTDEAGLGKTLVAEMTTAFLIAEKIFARLASDRRFNPSAEVEANPADVPLRVSIVVPARLRGTDEEDGTSGWRMHADRIEKAAKWALAVRVIRDDDTELKISSLDDHVDAISINVFSHSEFSRDLADDFEDRDDCRFADGPVPADAYRTNLEYGLDSRYPNPEEELPPNRENWEIADRLFCLATSEVVVVDESHAFRNDSSRATRLFRYALSLPIPGEYDWPLQLQTYEDRTDLPSSAAELKKRELIDENSPAFSEWRPRRRVLYLSATPFNNEVDDIVTQIGHFDQYQNWTGPLDAQTTIGDEDASDLRDALADWRRFDSVDLRLNSGNASNSLNTDFASPRAAFDRISRYIWHHIESGRSLRVDEDLRREREQRDHEIRHGYQYEDGGPEYEWIDHGETGERQFDRYTQVFAPAVAWARHQRRGRNSSEQGTSVESDSPLDDQSRNEIDSLLSDLMVQRSRRRVIENSGTRTSWSSERENVADFFRKPRRPRHPLPLNDQPGGDQNPFEAEVIEQLSELFIEQQSGETGNSERDIEGLNLFSYEIAIRRDQESLVPEEATETAVNAVGFQLLNLIKRLQSSPYAFMRSLIRGPLRRATRILAMIEAARHLAKHDDFEPDSAPGALSEELDTVLGDGFNAITHALDQSQLELHAFASILADEEGYEAGDSNSFGDCAGLFEIDGHEIDFHDDEFERLVWDFVGILEEPSVEDEDWPAEGMPEHSWLTALLSDVGAAVEDPRDCRLWSDIAESISWLTSQRFDLGNDEPVEGVVDVLYGALPDEVEKKLRLQPFGEVRRYFAGWRDEIEPATTLRANAEWIARRLDQDSRMRSLVGWLVVQAVGRREAVRKAQKDETSSGVQFFNDLDDDALAEFLPAGPRTLIFTEYTDTQEYLLACIEALEAVLRNTHLGADDEQQEYVSKDVRAPILNAIEEDVVPELVTESFSVRQDTEDRGDGLFQPPIGGAEPDDPLPDWLQQWLRSARNAEFSRDVFDEETARPTLAEIIRDIRKTGARVCSDETSRIVDIEEAAGDSDSTIDDPANADLEAEKPSRETGEADPVHAFSPWYQIEPESGMERSSAAAERLRNVVRRPVYTLLSTEVLAEGVNLQECGFIAHYDLPWNPTRLIQRNGRIDRRLNSRFENNEKRETLAEDLETYPAFVKPQQVYHATVVPVEPDFDGERESNYAHKVRKTLRRKLNTIRAIFGLSSWPVVLGPDSAEDVLTGELEFETPGFRRREDLFNTRRQLDKEREAVKERAGDDLSNYRKPELRSGEWINLPLRTDRECVEEILADLVGADTDGVEDSESGGREEGERTPREHFEAAKESWSDVVALCVSTWTPYRPDARPVRARYQLDASTSDEKTGVIQATLIVENREADGGVHLVTWTRVNRDSELGGRNMQDLETFAMTPDNGSKGTDYGFFRYLATLTEPGASTDREVYDRRSEFVPTTPTGFAEDIVARAADGVLSGHCDLPEGAEKSELSFKEDGLRTMAGGSTRSFFPDRVEDERSARADEQSGPGANFYRLLISWLNTVDPVGIGKLDNVLENDEESNIRSLRRTDTLPEGSGEPQFPTEFLPPDGIRTNLWLIPED